MEKILAQNGSVELGDECKLWGIRTLPEHKLRLYGLQPSDEGRQVTVHGFDNSKGSRAFDVRVTFRDTRKPAVVCETMLWKI